MNIKSSGKIDGYEEIVKIGAHKIDGLVLFEYIAADEVKVRLLLGIDNYNFYSQTIELTLENKNLNAAGKGLLAQELIKTYSMIMVPELMNLKVEVDKMKKPEIRATMGLKKTGDDILDTIYALLKRAVPYINIKQGG